MSKGIDISSYNGKIDWSQVKQAGVEFAILKIIRRDLNPDKRFEENYANAKAARVPVVGVYNYSYATTVEKAKSDAKKVVEILNGRTTTIWMDIEADCMKNLAHGLIDIVKSYSEVIVASGNNFGVYTGLAFYNSYFKPYANELNCKFWIARYHNNANRNLSDPTDAQYRPSISNELIGWQYCSKGNISGISGMTDLDEFYDQVAQVVDIKKNTTTQSSELEPNEIIRTGQHYANDFAHLNIKEDGFNGPETRKAKKIVLQHGMNLDYKSNLVEDGKIGSKSSEAAEGHYIKKGETQWMVTAVEIIMYLDGKNAGGIEYPGTYGNGLVAAVGKEKIEDFCSLVE